MIGGGRVALSKPGPRRQRCAGQRKRDAVAGQRGDDRRLIAEAEQAGRGIRAGCMEVSVRQAGNRQRPIEQRTRAGEPRRQMRTLSHQRVEQRVPSSTRGAQPCAAAPARTAPPDPPPRAAVRHSRRRTGPVRHGGAAPQAARRRARNTSSVPPGRCRVRVVATPRSSCLPVARNTVSATTRPSEPQSSRSDPWSCSIALGQRGRAAPWRRFARACRNSASSSARRDRPRAAKRQAAWRQRDSRAPDAPR